jgi:hypothetical protein
MRGDILGECYCCRPISCAPPAAFQVVRAVLLLPSDRLLPETLIVTKNQVSAALTDFGAIRDITERLPSSNPSACGRRVAVAGKPLITVSEHGGIFGAERMPLETNLFGQFATDPTACGEFTCNHWARRSFHTFHL